MYGDSRDLACALRERGCRMLAIMICRPSRLDPDQANAKTGELVVINLSRAGIVALAISIFPAHAEQQAAAIGTVIAQSPRTHRCIELPYAECVKCAMARGFSRAEARPYCQPRR